MASTKKEKPAEEAAAKEAGQAAGSKKVEYTASKYKVDELINASEKLFKVKKECAAAALKERRGSEMTVSEAAKTVENFMKKEVK